MKKLILILTILIFAAGTINAADKTKFSNNKKETKMENTKKSSVIFPLGSPVESNFTGDAWVSMMVTPDSVNNYDCAVYNVTFAPGTRNYWHVHSVGQILLCTVGTGYYQERGKAIRILHPGDVVNIPAHVEHWHGAAPNSQFTHVGITPRASENSTKWLEPVSDADYNSAKK